VEKQLEQSEVCQAGVYEEPSITMALLLWYNINMTRVEQYDWTKLQPPQRNIIMSAGSIRKRPISNSEIEYQEYLITVKDNKQNTTHKLHQWAKTQEDAEVKLLRYLKKALKHDKLEITKGKRQ